MGNTYNRVYIWCCKYGENRYCETCANKKWCASKHTGLLNSCLGKLCLHPYLVVPLISARVTLISTRVSAHCQAILLFSERHTEVGLCCAQLSPRFMTFICHFLNYGCAHVLKGAELAFLCIVLNGGTWKCFYIVSHLQTLTEHTGSNGRFMYLRQGRISSSTGHEEKTDASDVVFNHTVWCQIQNYRGAHYRQHWRVRIVHCSSRGNIILTSWGIEV